MGCVSVCNSTLFLAVIVTLNVSKALCLKVSMVTTISTNQGRCFSFRIVGRAVLVIVFCCCYNKFDIKQICGSYQLHIIELTVSLLWILQYYAS